MKRQAGRPSKDNLVPVGQNFSREELATQKTVDSKVLAILRECPETRYDDMQLILCYYNRYSYMRVGDLPLEDIVNNYKG